MVPKGWGLVEAQDVCERISVGIVVKPKDYYVPEGQGTKAFRSANVREGYVEDSKWTYISDEGHQKNKKSLLRTGDVLVVRTGYPGTACVVPEAYAGSNCIDIIFARPDTSQILPEYLCEFTNSEYGKKQVLDGQGGLAQQHFNVGAYNKLKVPLPPLPEQRKIADILSTWDGAIETTEALLATARAQKRALMQSLLTGKRRFPEFEGQEWKEVRLGDVASIDAKSLTSKTPNEFEFSYISLSNVEPGRVIGELARLTYAEAPSRARRVVRTGDLLVSTVRPNLMGFAKVGDIHSNCIASTGFAVVTPKKTTLSSYLFHYLFSHHMKSQLDALVVGSNYPAINSSEVKKLKVRMPNLEEQAKIGKILDDCDVECDHLVDSLTSLRTEKKALMQQLLTGKRRVAA